MEGATVAVRGRCDCSIKIETETSLAGKASSTQAFYHTLASLPVSHPTGHHGRISDDASTKVSYRGFS